ncbi:MAG: DinB family protein [Gammaproteobacteria bacterium]|nr:DinB family protein [Gammaproteobacteria bacterium]
MLRKALIHSLEQLTVIFDTLDTLVSEEANALFLQTGAGRHIRHISDHFLALQKGLLQDCVDYNQRHRDSPVESDRQLASAQVKALLRWCEQLQVGDKPLTVISEIDCLQTQNAQFKSSLHRELLYLINHTIHHVAHIKLLLAHAGVALPEYIGLAPGTTTFLRQNSAKMGAV